jgi:hypothetical protein
MADHSWINLDKISSGEDSCELIHEGQFPEEWLYQWVLGIKTILMIPLLPQGVLQLGSLEEVSEDLEVIFYIKSRFVLHYMGLNSAPFTTNKDVEAELSSILISNLVDELDETSTITLCPSVSEESTEIDNNCETVNQVIPLFTAQDTFYVCRNNQPEILDNANHLEMVESKMHELSWLEEELLARSQCYDEEFSNSVADFYSVGHTMEQQEDGNDTGHILVSSFLGFPKHSELHKALVPSFQGQTIENSWDPSSLAEDIYCNLGLISARDQINGIEPFVTEGNAGDLLEDVVSNAFSGPEETSDNISVEFSTSFNAQSGYEVHASAKGAEPDRCNTSDRDAKLANGFSTSPSFKSSLSAFVSEEPPRNNRQHPKKGGKPSKRNKIKARAGENQKPRPRDRQMIQDRLKELRELVPNGTNVNPSF